MLQSVKNVNILFLDIETVPMVSEYSLLSDSFKALWDSKSRYFTSEDQTPEDVFDRAGIYAEFGKIVCISVGYILYKNGETHFRLKSFHEDNEKELLENFALLLKRSFNSDEHFLCAHNGKEFDFPYIARRMLINGVYLPKQLDIAGKKPWEVKHLDTLELWKFGDYKHYTSLNLLTAIFKIPTPKDDISGADVASVYWQEKNFERIAVYCQKDVLAIAQLYLRYKNEELIPEQNIEIVKGK